MRRSLWNESRANPCSLMIIGGIVLFIIIRNKEKNKTLHKNPKGFFKNSFAKRLSPLFFFFKKSDDCIIIAFHLELNQAGYLFQ